MIGRTITDRFTRGFIAGLAAGVVMNLFNYFNYYILHATTLRMLDWAGVVIYGTKPEGLPESLFAQLVQLGFAGFTGGLFTRFIIPGIKSNNLYFKGFLYGTAIWFMSYALTIMLKVPHVSKIPFLTSLGNFIAAAIYGLVLAGVLQAFDNKAKEDL